MTQDPPRPGFWAHATALIDPPATIGDGTKIWHFAHVMSGAKIGAGCSLGQNVFVGARGAIGDRCKIQNNVSVYDEVVLGADVFVGPSAVFTNVVNPRAFVVRKDEYRRTEVEDGASIGANATIVCGHRLGAYCFVAAGAVVASDVAPYALVAGVPARRIGWICKCGVTLPRAKAKAKGKKAKRLTCEACGSRYALSGKGKERRLEPLAPGGPPDEAAPQARAEQPDSADRPPKRVKKAGKRDQAREPDSAAPSAGTEA